MVIVSNNKLISWAWPRTKKEKKKKRKTIIPLLRVSLRLNKLRQWLLRALEIISLFLLIGYDMLVVFWYPDKW